MELFRADGHLTEEALRALAENKPLDELHRLEAAEHLSFCDLCLQRYTDALGEEVLLAPAQSCRETIWRRIRARAVRLFTSRYATAAAAVALALVLVWGVPPIKRLPSPERASITERMERWPEQLGESLNSLLKDFGGLFHRPDFLNEYGGIGS